MKTAVTVTHLEMTSPDLLRAKDKPALDVARVLVTPALPELNRFFYTAVGGDWFWLERLKWTYEAWKQYLNRPELQTWLFTVSGVPAGYCELEQQAGENVEIVYFGILREFVGRGLGGWALSETTRLAWQLAPKRVWVHTCDLDHPGALANYLARGFTPFKTVTEWEDLPATSPGPWPNAQLILPSR